MVFEYEPVAAAYSYERTLDRDELILIGDFGGGGLENAIARDTLGWTRIVVPRHPYPIAPGLMLSQSRTVMRRQAGPAPVAEEAATAAEIAPALPPEAQRPAATIIRPAPAPLPTPTPDLPKLVETLVGAPDYLAHK